LLILFFNAWFFINLKSESNFIFADLFSYSFIPVIDEILMWSSLDFDVLVEDIFYLVFVSGAELIYFNLFVVVGDGLSVLYVLEADPGDYFNLSWLELEF